MRGGLVGPLCSRNAHDEAVLVRRAQWGTKPDHPFEREASELGRSNGKEPSLDARSETPTRQASGGKGVNKFGGIIGRVRTMKLCPSEVRSGGSS